MILKDRSNVFLQSSVTILFVNENGDHKILNLILKHGWNVDKAPLTIINYFIIYAIPDMNYSRDDHKNGDNTELFIRVYSNKYSMRFYDCACNTAYLIPL